MRRVVAGALCGALAAGPVPAALAQEDQEQDYEYQAKGSSEVKLNGYAEWRARQALVVEGQRVRVDGATKFKGKGQARDFESIPLGYEVKVKGTRDGNGAVLATEVEAKPNGEALFEGELRRSFDEMEHKFRDRGMMYEEDENGKREVIGDLWTEGPEVDRVRRIAEQVMPPYVDPSDFRVYVVDNKEWNAMAAPNNSIYVFSGLLEDLNDDEVAIVIGHELTHATHEHGRKGFKKQILMMLPVALLGALAEEIDSETQRLLLQLGLFITGTALVNGYGRGQEDQADRVGMRYAYEGHFDVRKGPPLWDKFARKYGEGSRFMNNLFGDHSLSKDRARNLQREIDFNYSN